MSELIVIPCIYKSQWTRQVSHIKSADPIIYQNLNKLKIHETVKQLSSVQFIVEQLREMKPLK